MHKVYLFTFSQNVCLLKFDTCPSPKKIIKDSQEILLLLHSIYFSNFSPVVIQIPIIYNLEVNLEALHEL